MFRIAENLQEIRVGDTAEGQIISAYCTDMDERREDAHLTSMRITSVNLNE